MPIRKVEYVDQPLVMKRHTPNYNAMAQLYSRGGEVLADLSIRRGETAQRTMATLAGLFSNFYDTGRKKKAAEIEQTIRATERAQDRAERTIERAAAAEERKTAREDRKYDADRGAARYAVDNAAPGPQSPALASLASRFPETAARFSQRAPLEASALPGTAPLEEGGSYPVLEPTAEQADRAGAVQRQIEGAKATEARALRDDVRADQQMAQTKSYQDRSLAIQAANAAARPDNTQAFVIRDGKVTPIKKGEALPGDVPYSADAMQGMGGESADARSMRTAAALNTIDKLKTMAPKRLEGPAGIVEGGWRSLKGAVGLDPQTEVYKRMLGAAAMQMAVAIQGAAGLSNAERETMKDLLGKIHTTDYVSQMELLEQASQMIRAGADVAQVQVIDPETKETKTIWQPRGRSRLPGGGVPVNTAPDAPTNQDKPRILSIVPVTKPKG